jgi:hypothetical protein
LQTSKSPGSGFGTGLARLISALDTDLDWLREHTRLLQRASEWEAAGRAESRLLFGDSIAAAKAWFEPNGQRARPCTSASRHTVGQSSHVRPF